MKRILGMVVAIAGLLAFSSAANAALVTFDISSGQSWSRSGDANAGDPFYNGGLCPPGIAEGVVNTCFRYNYSPASYVTLDIVGSSVTVMGGVGEIINASANVQFGTIILTTTGISTFAGPLTTGTPGATGTLVGDSILWDTPMNYTSTGTITCTGINCGLISFPPGVPLPLDPYLYLVTNSTPNYALVLGEWLLDPTHTQILASSNAISRWSNVAESGNRRQGFSTFGATSLGNPEWFNGAPVPEPASGVLVLLGLGALALRARKA